jgi:cyclic pyranopterin monophosphate synthase
MVDVGGKDVTDREAVASCRVVLEGGTVRRLMDRTPKGDPIEAARVAGVMAVKRTPDLLPFCHPVAVTGAEVTVAPDPESGTIVVQAAVRASDRTGVEMEALTACAVAALSLYDTAKAFDRAARITDLRLLEKRGGIGGEYRAT